jgi:signal transduction histidine kinase/CheY-like chemotaxis protein
VKHVLPTLRIWVGVAALAIVLALLVSYRTIRESQISTAAVDHTRQTLSALIALEGTLGDLLFASGDQGVARASDAAVRRVNDLSALTLDNPRQQQNLQHLRGDIAAVVRTRQHGPDGEVDNSGEALVPQSLSQTVRNLRVEELQLLTSRVETSQRTFRQLTSVLYVTGLGSGVLLVWVFGLVVRGERKRRQADDMLRQTNEELDARVSARTAELHDTLDREQTLRLEAETNSRLKDEFLMTVSHELRTPLNALLGWADMLRLGIVSEARRQRAVDAICDNAKLQTQLIADLLDTARILTGKLRIEPAWVNLAEIVQEAANIVVPAAAAKGLELKVELDPQGCTLFGDPGRLQQIVWNLVSNAVKFTERGTVSVSLARSEPDNHITIVIADTGMGIHQQFLPHVFDRFSQEKTGTTRRHGGLGLGLAIVRQLVELHGGTVHVDSRGEGQGTTVTVNLPIGSGHTEGRPVPQAHAEAAAVAGSAQMPVLDGIHVLVVDDDVSAREIATVTLEHCGARVTTADSAAQAREALVRGACDVLLVDIAMPHEDGYSFVGQLRAQGLRQPIAALTAQAHEIDRARALASGFDVHIPKPIEPRALAQAVAALAGR